MRTGRFPRQAQGLPPDRFPCFHNTRISDELPSGSQQKLEHLSHVRGALLAKGPDSSLGEVHRRSCCEDINIEDEKVEVKVQKKEVEDREKPGKE